jgi:DNA polymerase-1
MSECPLTIPEGFNGWGRLTQIEYYLEQHLVIHPCYGPKAKCGSPGKQPRWQVQQRLAASKLEVLDHFKRHPDDNIGMVPTGNHVVLDPDLNKELKARGDLRPLEDWHALHPKLFEHLHAICDRGPHHHVLCSGIPAGQGKINVPNYLPGLSLEIFVGQKLNVILPPSVHPSGHIYRWGAATELVLGFPQLLDNFRVNGERAQAPSQDDGSWKSTFKGDLRTLAVKQLCKALDIYGQALDAEHGQACTVVCPWRCEHTGTGENWSPKDSSTAVFCDPGKYPGFKCLHAHCEGRSIKDFLLWCEEQEPGIVDRHCQRTFQQRSSASQEQQEEYPDYTRKPWPPSTAKPEEFEQKIFYPENSALHSFMEYGRTQTEGSDAYLLGSILAVCAGLVGRRVYIDFGGTLYLNLFNLIVGRPGDRKSFTIKLAARIARLLLNAERFLPPILSVEGLFDEYCQDEGGDPDQICIVDDAAIVLSTWRSSTYGERVADLMLRLYDCEALSEAFRRNKKKKGARSVKRTIPETSTTLLFGATFADALFSKQKSQQGLARRFLYYLASTSGRFIKWPTQQSIEPIADLFKPLLAFKGPLRLAPEADGLWEEFQHANRARLAEVPENRPDLAHALSSEPTHVLKVAALFELATAAARRQTSKRIIGPESLQTAIEHVAENLRAGAHLFHRAQQLEAREKAEEILAKIRAQFARSKKYPDSIFADRTRLTSNFCNQTSRRGALTTEELYLQILPDLIRQGQAQLCLKKGRFEVYAFRASDLNCDQSAPGSSEPISTISTPPRACKKEPLSMHIVRERNNIKDVNGPVEIVEIATPSPRDVDLLNGTLALDLETCAEPKISRRGTPNITTTREALSPWKGEIRLLTLADPAGAIQSFDLRTEPLPDEIRAAIERSTLIVHNACFDLLFLKVRLGFQPASVFCTMTAARLLNPVRSTSNKLGPVLAHYLDVKLPKEHGGSDWGAFVLTDGQLAYARNDVRYLHRLQGVLETELERVGLKSVFALEMNLIPIVVAMEHHGFTVHRSKLEEMASTAAAEALSLAKGLRDAFATPALNPESPSQLLEAFKAAGVELPDTSEDVLTAIGDPRARLILDFRAAAKLEIAAKGLLKAVGPDGRIHARFNPTGSLAGRFSSSSPNLQNITRGPLRSAFVARAADRVLVVADYSQIELRIGAWYAADQVMLEAFRANKDLHEETAAAVQSKSVAEVTRDDRQLAKAVNFGFLYGQRASGFQTYARTGYGIVLSKEEAHQLREKFFARYKGLKDWHALAWEKAENGLDENCTILGRRLVTQGDRDWDSFQLHTNYIVQGSAADVLKCAMVKTTSVLPGEVYLVATVHDELVFDVPFQEAAQYKCVIAAAMEQVFTEIFGPELPIKVEAKICENWAKKDGKGIEP